MIAAVQRVSAARLRADGADTARIGRGLFVLLGVEKGDAESDALYIANKVAGLRIFERDEKMDLSVSDIGGEVLLVSQFTLCGDARHGRRPDFTAAAPPAEAEALYERVAALLREAGLIVGTGVFGAHMEIDAALNGPVTILLNSKKLY
jgi:D-tyrosyl-tRNA(Tyr) deacylase